MWCKFLLFLAASLLTSSALAIEEVAINYQYTGDHGIDFSEMDRGSLAVGKFNDARDTDNPHLITTKSLGDNNNSEGYQASAPIADLVRTAFEQAFQSGNAQLATDDASALVRLTGQVVSLDTELESVGEGTNLTVSLRVKAELKNSNKTLWQNTLFSRARAPNDSNLADALTLALDTLIEELLYDDYFLFELLD